MKVFEQRITARSEDIDELGHVNNAAWVRWASVTLGYQSRRLCRLSSSASSSTRGCPGSCPAAVIESASVIDRWASRSPTLKARHAALTAGTEARTVGEECVRKGKLGWLS